jgi:hypothetical protein
MLLSPVSFGQVTVDEATAKLKAKQQATDEQQKMAQITEDDLQKLREAIVRLSRENEQLRSSASANPAIPATLPAHRFRDIELGMTRDELDKFIADHADLKLVGRTAATGVKHDLTETVTRRNMSGASDVQRNGVKTNLSGVGSTMVDQTIEKKVSGPKRESLTFGVFERVYIPPPPTPVYRTGSRASGVSGPSGEIQVQQRSAIHVELEDDVVTRVERTEQIEGLRSGGRRSSVR